MQKPGNNTIAPNVQSFPLTLELIQSIGPDSEKKRSISSLVKHISGILSSIPGSSGNAIYLTQRETDTTILALGTYWPAWISNPDQAPNISPLSPAPFDKIQTIQAPSPLFSQFPHYADEKIRTFLSVPLFSIDDWIGMVHIFFQDSKHDELLLDLSHFGKVAGSFIRNLQLEQIVDHKAAKLSTLYEVSRMTHSFIQLNDAMNSVVDVVQAMIEFDLCILYSFDSEKNELVIRRAKGIKKDDALQNRVKAGDGLAGQVLLNQEPVLSHYDDYKSFLAVPILMANKLTGVLALGSYKSYAYTKEDIISVNILASQIASIDNMITTLISMKSFTESILDSMPGGVVTVDMDGNLLHLNPSAQRLLPQLTSDMTGKNHKDIFGPEHPFSQMLAQTLEDTGESRTKDIQLACKTREITAETTTFPFRDEKGTPIGAAIFFKDVSEIRRLKEQLRIADRLGALGELAMGVAHEIRNPLTGINMVVQLLQNELEPNDPRQEHTRLVISEVERLEKTIADLLSFAKPASPVLKPTNLVETVETTVILLSALAKKNGIEISFKYPEEMPLIFADPFQMRQVVLNILQNALQAIENQGKISILLFQKDDDFINLQIDDTGKGISQEHLKQAFDPFFTTKDKGTGLGLAIAARILEEHNGRIDIESFLNCPAPWNEKGGTRVNISMPIFKEGRD